MITPVITQVMLVLIKVFPIQPNQNEALRLMQSECGKNLPGCETETPMTPQLKRIRLAALKVSEGNIEKLRQAVALAKKDWRDLLVAAGFENDLDAADKWAQQILAKR